MILEARKVGWSVRGKPIVADVSLVVNEGETLALVGPNGSGKSTLMKLLAGIRLPTSGDVLLQGKAVAGTSRRDAARLIAFLEQQSETIEAITVTDAVQLGRTPWLSPLQPWAREDDEIVAEALADTDMTGFENRLWRTLSGGERQRVHLARALAQKPKILLLDEPTNLRACRVSDDRCGQRCVLAADRAPRLYGQCLRRVPAGRQRARDAFLLSGLAARLDRTLYAAQFSRRRLYGGRGPAARCARCNGTGIQADARTCALCGGNGRCQRCTNGADARAPDNCRDQGHAAGLHAIGYQTGTRRHRAGSRVDGGERSARG